MVLNPFSLARHPPEHSLICSCETQGKRGVVSGMIGMMGVGWGGRDPRLDFHLLLSSGSFNMAFSRVNCALKENACTAGYLSHQSFSSINLPTHFPFVFFLYPASHLQVGVFGNRGSTIQVEWAPHLTSFGQRLASVMKAKERKQVNIFPKSIDANILTLSLVLFFNL